MSPPPPPHTHTHTHMYTTCLMMVVHVSTTGAVAWRLYDTYGFPVDLTTLMAEERKMKVDMQGFEEAKLHAQVSGKGGRGGGKFHFTHLL